MLLEDYPESVSMTGSDTQFNYTVARVLHWAAGVIIIFNLLSGWRMDSFPLEIKTVLLMFHSGVFYPLLLMQAVIGVTLAAFIDYDVLAFGFVPYSAIAADSESLHAFFLQLHGTIAWVLIALVVVHGGERWRMIFVDDPDPAPVQKPASTN